MTDSQDEGEEHPGEKESPLGGASDRAGGVEKAEGERVKLKCVGVRLCQHWC